MADLPPATIGSPNERITVSVLDAPSPPPTVATIVGWQWGAPPIEMVQSQTIKIYRVAEDKLEMLAALPRRRWVSLLLPR
jgi:hypothetical protein